MANYRRKIARFEWGSSRQLFKYRAGDDLTALGAVFTRTGEAKYLDANGVLQTAATGVPRDAHYISGERTLLLEEAATNLCLRSREFDHATWTKTLTGGASAPVVTANDAIAPDGTTTADRVVFVAPVSGDISELAQGSIPTVASSSYAQSVWVKAYAAADVGKVIAMRNVALSTYTLITLTANWQRVQCTEVAAGASSSLSYVLRPSVGTSSGTVTCWLWESQLELGKAATSEIATTSAAATRNAETLYFPYLAPPQVLTMYVRGREKMRADLTAVSTTAIAHIGNAASAEARAFLYRTTAETGYRFQHDPVSAGAASSNQGSAGVDAAVELRGELQADGAVRVAVSVNGGAESYSGPSTAQPLVGAWSDTRLYLNSFGAGSRGAFAFREVLVLSAIHSFPRLRAAASEDGTTFETLLSIGYPIDEAVSYSRPAEGSRMLLHPSGEVDGWDAGTAHFLDAVLRWVPREDTATPLATGWDGAAGVRAFLEHCRRGNAVWFTPDVTDLAAGWTVHLEAPFDEPPELEADMTRAVRMRLRATTAIDGY